MNKKALFSNLKIRTKLIILFIIIKVIPILLVSFIAYKAMNELFVFFNDNTNKVKETSKEVVSSTANTAIKESILALDRKSQKSLEILSNNIALSVSEFLYERDNDLLLLSQLPVDKKTYQSFLNTKTKSVLLKNTQNYIYDDANKKWIDKNTLTNENILTNTNTKDNQREFQRIDLKKFPSKKLPIYKELTFFDLDGKEQIKLSSLDPLKKDISKKQNTYIGSENYFQKIQKLQKGEIYVSEVIGAYVPSHIIGTFTKEKAQKSGIEFDPTQHAYAGKENPKGKMFEGIIRFITPLYKSNKKIGFISLALDHRHIMEFTDTLDPLNYSKTNISDASVGNYAFMWDNKGRNISHPRDYFIIGFDPTTGERVIPWLSQEVMANYKASKIQDINKFLKEYPTFKEQSLKKEPVLEQIQQGTLGLDCRYLNFAPQCQGWMEVTQNGGMGSFIIYWSNVWKLTTAATIPYYTGQYGDSKRGFGFVTIGANVDEFHKAAYETKENIDTILIDKMKDIDNIIKISKEKTESKITSSINELTLSTVFMIVLMILIAIWLSNYIRHQIDHLLKGAKEFSKNNLTYKIPVKNNDEIGKLSYSFNKMAQSLKRYIEETQDLNRSLEDKVQQRTSELSHLNKLIQNELQIKIENEEKLNLFAKIFNNSSEGVIIIDLKGKIAQVNPSYCKITQYQEKELIGKSHKQLKSYRQSKEFYKKMWDTILAKNIWEGEVWNKKKDNSLYPAFLSIVPILDNDNNIRCFAGILKDISIIKQKQQELHKKANYDSLTNLPNRALGYDRLEHAILYAKENNSLICVMFLDLDKFKFINDTMGHDTGDLLLCEVSTRLLSVCKKSDTVCRLGGDEFLIILEDIDSFEYARTLAEKIINIISDSFHINNKLIKTSTSIGITFYPNDGEDIKTLLKHADISMYNAKAKGRGTYEFFTKELGESMKQEVQLEQELHQALLKNELFMQFQPIYNLQTQEILGFEALMRWNKNGEIQYPDSFIPILENTGLIIGATCNVIPHTLEFIKYLNDTYNKSYYISINISPSQFKLENFYENFIQRVKESKLDPSLIYLEITETVLLDDFDTVIQKLDLIKQYGFKVVLDDFGTGYSSLEYIKKLPVDRIKIDKSFIHEIEFSIKDQAIVNTICSLGSNLGLEVTAEGIENEHQYQLLLNTPCHSMQGYFLSKPQNKDTIEEKIKNL